MTNLIIWQRENSLWFQRKQKDLFLYSRLRNIIISGLIWLLAINCWIILNLCVHLKTIIRKKLLQKKFPKCGLPVYLFNAFNNYWKLLKIATFLKRTLPLRQWKIRDDLQNCLYSDTSLRLYLQGSKIDTNFKQKPMRI